MEPQGERCWPPKNTGPKFPPLRNQPTQGHLTPIFVLRFCSDSPNHNHLWYVWKGLVIISPLGIGFMRDWLGTCRFVEDVLTEKIRSQKMSIKKHFSRHFPPFWRASKLLGFEGFLPLCEKQTLTHHVLPAFRVQQTKWMTWNSETDESSNLRYEISFWVLSCISWCYCLGYPGSPFPLC